MNQRPLLPLSAKLGGVILLGTLILLSVIPKGSTIVFTWPWVFYSQALLVAPFFLAAMLHLHTNRPHLNGGPAFLFCALSWGLSVLLSRNPAFSFECTLILWGNLAFCWWLAHAFRSRFDTVDASLTRIGTLSGLLLLLPVLSSLGFWLPEVIPPLLATTGSDQIITVLAHARNPHPFGHWNYTGAFGLLAFPWFVSLAFLARGLHRAGWSLAAALGLLLILSSGSRGAILGLLALAAATFGLALASGGISRRKLIVWITAAASLAGVLVLTNARLRGYVLEPASILQPNGGDVQRLAMTQGGWLLGLQRPWVGHGPGMVPFVYPEIRAQLVGGVETSYQLHNAWLHLWVTTGFLGLIAIITLALVLGRATRRWLVAPPSPTRTLALTSAATLASYAVFAATDYQLDVIGITAAISLHGALVLSALTVSRHKESKPRRLPGILLIGSALVTLAVLLPAWRARQLHWAAWANNLGDDPPARLAALARAAAAAPKNPHYQNQLAFQLALAAATPAERAHARLAFAQSLALDPSQEPVLAAQGWLWLQDDPREAGSSFRAALSLLPDRPTLHLGLAYSALALGQRDPAIQALALECLVHPRFLISPVWVDPALQTLQPAVVARLNTLYAQALAHPALPRWRQPDLIYARALCLWWTGGRLPNNEELKAATPLQRSFFNTIADNSSRWPEPWATLAVALAQPHQAQDLLNNPALGLSDLAVTGALARLNLAARPTDLVTLLHTPAPQNAGVIGARIERVHYSLMHRNLDGHSYADINPRFSDAFALHFVGPLFPLDGLIPGPILHDLRR